MLESLLVDDFRVGEVPCRLSRPLSHSEIYQVSN